MWLTRLLYSIDILVQQQISLFEDGGTPMHLMSYHPITEGFNRLQDEVIRRNLSTSIPDSIIQTRSSANKKRKSKDESQDTNKKPDHKPNDRTTTNSSTYQPKKYQSPTSATNHRINPSWRVPEGKSFRDCFITNNLLQETPKINNTPFCLQFHTKGYCTRGAQCQLSHDDPRDVRLDRNFSSFIDRAYGRSPQNNQNHTPSTHARNTNQNSN
jgi:hypothetical protein